ncbi:hypothetical protein [Streptomyces sp. McG3]|uniref:hypothetical protein n=1 Tax=unclassified Streptomyces TaxID=2593676 RepID=UPI001BE6183F|nr:hypothetical protein [Streptomyces sp. McG3]MBT2896915.1 hypothetical protein [Streptomyces sp. McG3]
MTKKVFLAVVSVSLGAAALVGCGGEKSGDEAFGGKSADTIAADAVKATRDAKSLRVTGNARQKGGNEIGLDFHVDDQDRCKGTMTGRGAKADVLQVGQQVYVRGDKKFWQNSLQGRPGTDGAIEQLQGKWVKSEQGQSGTEGMCDKQAFLASLDSDKSERKGLKKGDTTEIDGKSVLALEKKQSDGEKITMYVATEGEPYILKAVTEGGDAPGEVVLSDYDKKVEAQAPADADVVDPKKISS